MGPALDVSSRVKAIADPKEIDSLRIQDLSNFFNPFLSHFMREVLRCGGEVVVSKDGPEVDGIYLHNEVERVATIFSRSRSVAETLFRLKDHIVVFTELELQPGGEIFHILGVDIATWAPIHPFTHSVRIAHDGDREAILQLMEEQYGPVDPRWLTSKPPLEEKGFVVEVAGSVAGVGWVSIVDRQGRLHSLSVRPRYRGIGIGTDLWYARMLWSRDAGAVRIISEVSEHNLPSRSIAERGGMRNVGQMFLYHRP